MGRFHATNGLAAVAAVLVTCAGASAQDALQTRHWPRSDISFPIDVAALESQTPRPVSLRFYAAPPNKPFKLVANKRPDELDKIIDKQDPSATPKRGFTYTAAADGVEEFAVQYEFADRSLTPKTPVPQYRIHFDTRPPTVRTTATSGNSIRWLAEDENLVASSVRVEGRYPGETQWQILNTGDLRADDSFKWPTLPPTKTLEVRVYAKDQAGNGGYSPVVKLGDGFGGRVERDRADRSDNPAPRRTNPGSFGDPGVTRTDGGGRTGSGFGGLDEFPTTKAKIQYVSTRDLTVKSKVTHVTRSGVKAAQLYVQNDSADWRPENKKDNLAMWPDTPDLERVVEIPYTAARDGLYGFIIQPISGANTKADDPRPGDAPQYLVEVDTIKPELSIKTVRVAGNGLTGPLVEVEWLSTEKNEMPEPIDLEYHTNEDDMRVNKGWKPMTANKIANTGRYTWEITDKKLWKFWVRASATDKAGNTAVTVYSDDKGKPLPILVDLDKPAGNVEKVDKNGEGVPRKQVNFDGGDRFQQNAGAPGQLNIKTTGSADEPKVAPIGVGGNRLGAPPTTKKPDPVPVAAAVEVVPMLPKTEPMPVKVEPMPVVTLPASPDGGAVGVSPPAPYLPPVGTPINK